MDLISPQFRGDTPFTIAARRFLWRKEVDDVFQFLSLLPNPELHFLKRNVQFIRFRFLSIAFDSEAFQLEYQRRHCS